MKTASEMIDFFRSKELFLIVGHVDPDGDCLSSELGISALLKAMGKKTILFNKGDFLRSEIREYEPLFLKEIQAETYDPKTTAVVVVDCSTLDRIGPFHPLVSQYPTAVIDHHSAGSPFGDFPFLDPESPSTTMLVFKLFQTASIEPDSETASLLFFGFATDTGFFRHLSERRYSFVEDASKLMKYGASPRNTYRKVFSGKSKGSRLLLGKILSRLEYHFDGKLVIVNEYLSDFDGKIITPNDRDADTLYNILLLTEGVSVVVYIKQEERKKFTVGLRSVESVDVGSIAHHYNGGGHKLAAGFTYKGNRKKITKELISKIGTTFCNDQAG